MARPLFLVSAPRSGSTFLSRALDAHPSITLSLEAGWIPFLRKVELLATTPAMREIRDGEGFETVGVIPERYVEATGRAFQSIAKPFVETFFDAAIGGTGDAWFGDKVHSRNDAEFAARAFPDARFVLLIRDLRDVVVSTYEFEKKQPVPWQNASFELRCTHLAEMFDGFDSGLSNVEQHRVRYEDLMQNQAAEFERLLAFLDLDDSSGSVANYLDGESKKLFSSHGTSKDPAASIGRWREHLTGEQLDVYRNLLESTNRRLGYE